MLRERRNSISIIAEILEGARKGETITKIVGGHRISYGQAQNYLGLLIKSGLLKIEKNDSFFLSKDGRKYNLLYTTTDKGIEFLKYYNNIRELLTEKGGKSDERKRSFLSLTTKGFLVLV